jgi:hypothetical protein
VFPSHPGPLLVIVQLPPAPGALRAQHRVSCPQRGPPRQCAQQEESGPARHAARPPIPSCMVGRNLRLRCHHYARAPAARLIHSFQQHPSPPVRPTGSHTPHTTVCTVHACCLDTQVCFNSCKIASNHSRTSLKCDAALHERKHASEEMRSPRGTKGNCGGRPVLLRHTGARTHHTSSSLPPAT